MKFQGRVRARAPRHGRGPDGNVVETGARIIFDLTGPSGVHAKLELDGDLLAGLYLHGETVELDVTDPRPAPTSSPEDEIPTTPDLSRPIAG